MKTASHIDIQGAQVFLRALHRALEVSLKLPAPYSAWTQSHRFSVDDAERIALEILEISKTARQLPDPLI